MAGAMMRRIISIIAAPFARLKGPVAWAGLSVIDVLSATDVTSYSNWSAHLPTVGVGELTARSRRSEAISRTVHSTTAGHTNTSPTGFNQVADAVAATVSDAADVMPIGNAVDHRLTS